MLFHALRFPWKQRLAGVSAAIAIVAAWWVPTAQRYGGSLLVPLSSSRQQAHHLAQGILTGHLGVHAAVNAVHTVAGIIMTWGLLTPAVYLGGIGMETKRHRPQHDHLSRAGPGLLSAVLLL